MDRTDEVQRLQSCINNLVSLLALPTLWSGLDPHRVVDILLDVLVSMLQLDFAYARLNILTGGLPIQAIRVPRNTKCRPNPWKLAETWKKGCP